jgi:hypothetical protein
MMRRGKSFGGRAAIALAALALAVQASLPLLLAVELRVDAADALAMESPPPASAAADRAAAATATPLDPDHHCTCPTCQILAAAQSFPLASHPILAVPQPTPGALIALESAPPPPAPFPSSHQARAPPVAG